LINGGIMAFHDTIRYPRPKKVVEESVYKSKNFRNIGLVGTITFAEKVEQNSIKDRLRNRYILLLNDLCEVAGKLQLPIFVKMIGRRLIKLIQ
jgi:hypothetical protein